MDLKTAQAKAKVIVDQILAAFTPIVSNREQKAEIEREDLVWLCIQLRDLFLQQPSFLQLGYPLNICGDIHGQFADLLNIFKKMGCPSKTNYLFLGDYVDRGKNSIETITLLFCFKLLYPMTFFLLRGNHECCSISQVYGFYDECKRRYDRKLWKTFCDVFDCMPPVALVGGRILCMHGGISPDLKDFRQLKQIQRPCDIPDDGLLCDLLWSDPDPDQEGWQPNDRGVSYTFGKKELREFLDRYDLDLVVRAHQVVEDGYEFFANRGLVTIFSAPNYCGEFDNCGGTLVVDKNFKLSFVIFNCNTTKEPKYLPPRPSTPPPK